MSLASDYSRQFAWRAWSRVLDALPPLAGRTVDAASATWRPSW